MSCQEQLQGVIPPQNIRPVRVFSQDESRFGLLTIRRRRLTAGGVQPVGLIQHVFEWFYVVRQEVACVIVRHGVNYDRTWCPITSTLGGEAGR